MTRGRKPGTAGTSAPSRLFKAPKPPVHDAFVSYARADENFVARLAEELSRRDKTIWIDSRELLPSAEWRLKIEDAIRGSRGFVFVLSSRSLTSRECAAELEHAAGHGKRIVPIRLADVDADTVPASLRDVHWLDARSATVASVAEELAETLDLDLDWVDTHTDLLRRAHAWERRGRKRALLLRGAELRTAAKALDRGAGSSRAPTLIPLQREFIAAGRQAARRRRVIASGAALAAAAVTVMGGAFAVRQRDQAMARGLAFLADQQLKSDPERGLLLALWAYDVMPNWDSEAVVRAATAESRISRTLRDHDGVVFGATFSADGRLSASAGQDGRVVVRDGSGRTVREYRLPGEAAVARFSPDGRRLAAGGTDGAIRLWQLSRDGPPTVLHSRHGTILDLEFHPERPWVAVATEDGVVEFWHVDGRRVHALRAGGAPVRGIGFDLEGRLVSADDEGRIRRWDATPSRGRVLADVGVRLYGVDVSRDGRFVTAAADDGRLRVWTASGRRVALIRTTTGFTEASFDATGRQIVIASADGSAYAWDWATHEPTAELSSAGGPLQDAEFSPDGTRVLTAAGDGNVRVWTPRPPVILDAGRRGVSAAQWTPDGHRILAAGADGRILIWDWATRRPVLSFRRHRGYVNDAALSANGRRVASAAGGDGSVFVWNATTGQVIASWQVPGVESVAISPDGTRAAAADATGNVLMWDVGARDASWRRRTRGPVGALAFSPDGRRLAAGSNTGLIQIWPVVPGAPGPTSLRGHTGVVSDLMFSEHGTAAVSVGADRTVRSWDVTRGEQLTVGRYHQGHVVAVDARPYLTVSGGVGGLVVASLAGERGTGNVILTRHVGAVSAVDLHPDGQLVLSASPIGAIKVSRCECGPIAEILRLARTRVSRALSPEEREAFGDQARRL